MVIFLHSVRSGIGNIKKATGVLVLLGGMVFLAGCPSPSGGKEQNNPVADLEFLNGARNGSCLFLDEKGSAQFCVEYIKWPDSDPQNLREEYCQTKSDDGHVSKGSHSPNVCSTDNRSCGCWTRSPPESEGYEKASVVAYIYHASVEACRELLESPCFVGNGKFIASDGSMPPASFSPGKGSCTTPRSDNSRQLLRCIDYVGWGYSTSYSEEICGEEGRKTKSQTSFSSSPCPIGEKSCGCLVKKSRPGEHVEREYVATNCSTLEKKCLSKKGEFIPYK